MRQWLISHKTHGKMSLIVLTVLVYYLSIVRTNDYDYLVDLSHQIQAKLQQRGGGAQVSY